MSTWLRDYLYIPLGGNRGSATRTQVNLMLTMLLGGLWHGAAWTFVLWGGYHGALLVIDRLVRGRVTLSTAALPAWLARIGTFHLVCLGWILFRAQGAADVGGLLQAFTRPGFRPTAEAMMALVALALAIVAHGLWSAPRLRRWHVSWPPVLQGVGYAILAVLVFLFSPASERFIYFQF